MALAEVDLGTTYTDFVVAVGVWRAVRSVYAAANGPGKFAGAFGLPACSPNDNNLPEIGMKAVLRVPPSGRNGEEGVMVTLGGQADRHRRFVGPGLSLPALQPLSPYGEGS